MKILVVDDDEISRKMICATIGQLASELREASGGDDGLRVARDWRPDIVILDVMMPGVDGYEICYAIKTAPELRHTRVIMLTSRDDADGISTGREASADAYLLKPFDPDTVLATIMKLSLGQPGVFPSPGTVSQ